MRGRHSTRQDVSATGGEAATLDQLEARPELFHELWDLFEVVAIIGVSHHYPSPPRCPNASDESVSVAPFDD